MKYEFNVGDYVETIDGYKGKIVYISKICPCYIYFNMPNCCKSEWRVSEEEIIKSIKKGEFNRIGKYDFTKPQKIEKLYYGHIDKKHGTKIEVKADGETLTSEGVQDIYVKTTNVEIIDKINEIIDRLNEMSKENED